MTKPVAIGIRAPHNLFAQGPERISTFAAEVESAGLGRVWVGDHVSFRGGQGYDGLLQAAVLATVTRHVTIQTAVYLLPLRHPLPVARQVASVAEIAPGRLVFGVGVGGDDPSETANCGVDHGHRGRRTDESLSIIRRLLSGEAVDHAGADFQLSGASIRPVPKRPVAMVVGGRSDAALRRAGRLSEGWLAVFTDVVRFSAGVERVQQEAAAARRKDVDWVHGLLVWCGFGSDAAAGRGAVAPAMEELYRMPFERFERYVPCGRPEDVAETLDPYVLAGADYLLLSPLAQEPGEALEGAATVQRLFAGS